METLLNIIRREAERIVRRFYRPTEVGVVDSYDPETHSVKLKMQPYEHLTGWIQLPTHHIGNGYGLAIGASPGEQFYVSFRNGDQSTPYITGRVYSDQEQPPKVESKEINLSNFKKTKIFFDKDDNMTFEHSTGTKTVYDKSGDVTHTHKGGNVIRQDASGVLIKNGNFKALYTAQGVDFTNGYVKVNGKKIDDTHTHRDVEPGGGVSGVPV